MCEMGGDRIHIRALPTMCTISIPGKIAEL